MNPATTQRLAGLAEPLRTRIAQLLAAAGDQVWIVSGRRTMDEQIQLRRAHCGTTWADIWTKPASQCHPATAIPGTSRHETGTAVDLGGNLSLAKQLAGALNLVTPVPGEAWHFEVAGAPRQGVAGIGVPDLGDLLPGGAGAAVDIAEGAAGLAGIDIGRIAVTAVLLAGGVALIVLGGVRGTTSRGGNPR